MHLMHIVDVMARKGSTCGICENVNLPSVCAPCVNSRLNDKYKLINALKREHISLNKRLDEKLKAKDKAGDQRRWMQLHAEKLVLLKERLHLKQDQLMKEKFKLEEKTNEFHSRETLLADASDMLERNMVEKLEKFYPDEIRAQNLAHTTVRLDLLQAQSVAIRQLGKVFPLCKVHDGEGTNKGLSSDYHQICGVHLPRGTNPHSDSVEELGASLGYMLQLLNLVVRYLYAPLLLTSGFAGSCSRVWQRASYWNSQPASRSNEHPLFIPTQIGSIPSQGNSWSEKSSSDYGVASIEPTGRTHSDGATSSSFKYGSSSLHSIETRTDLEEGICLLKKSVACVTANVFNSFCMPSPTQLSTFEGFEKMLAFVCSIKARALLSSNEAKSRRYMQQPNKLGIDQSVADSRISSSSLGESKHAKTVMPNNLGEDQSIADSRISSSSLRESKHKSLPRGDGSRRITSLAYPNQLSDAEKAQSVFDEWDMVEHPTLPPPSSQPEDIEHWTRAMMLTDKGNDAKKK
ncbi:uncharacterized protein LOC131068436 isoform X3 [Cryptomeria japonica]|uniref:uncharacterized protein LOC131068436 isoform X3 n=1 Tax=Cryptomeria japonica TaxID=3369 RepID=UPI0027DA42EC|nr:uncharacterized protein LOC131068436 isoform X3 [Cryptomeria japonica]